MSDIHLVYGLIASPEVALAGERAAHPRDPYLSPLSARLTDGWPALRLNTPGWIAWTADTASAMPDTNALLTFCRQTLQRRATIFSLAIRTFVNACLDFAESEVERRRDELEQRLDAAGLPRALGFPQYRDWIFSAFLPLPNVYIAVDAQDSEESFVRVDALLWDGTSALAVVLEGRSMMTPRTSQSLERLQAAHPTISVARIPWSPRADSTNHENLPVAYLSRFLDDVKLPFGPYRVASAPSNAQ